VGLVAGGAKRSGKSHLSAHLIIYWLVRHDANVVCFRKVKETLRDSCFNALLQAINDFGLKNYFRISQSPLRMTYLPTGAEILFRGMNGGKKQSNFSGINLGSIEFSTKKKVQVT